MSMELVTTSLVEQLVEVYEKEETWHQTKLSKEEAFFYHQILLNNGRILPFAIAGELVAYVESWRLNFQQLGRILCNAPFSPLEEDVATGNICYGANIWIKQAYRGTKVDKLIRNLFFQQNFLCEFFLWKSSRKKVQVLKVFKRQEFYNKYFTQEGIGDLDGKRKDN